MKILVTGGAGYIGTHTLVELLAAGHEPVVVDNLCNSKAEALSRVRQISGQDVVFERVDLRDAPALEQVFARHPVDAVVHFAGLKAVGESTEQPLLYYDNNVAGTLTLCRVMEKFDVRHLVFSSSATVYGDPQQVPINEEAPLGSTNPYGRTKQMVEDILRDLAAADARWHITLLRYFNPVGAHPSGLIGEDPNGIPNNLMPYIAQVAVGHLPELRVFGNDYATPDGTGVRDYIHVVDLARGHLAALQHGATAPGVRVFNLGTGQGYSVLEMLKAFEQACGRELAFRFHPRRPGDVARCYADPGKAERELGWRAQHDLAEMAADSWRWQLKNPHGYSVSN
ncbi:UDP-glucose 4-epimerase GalE [Thiorhodovibrio frisius]|uniref:UDP-glucose 4-epimerase n=1 Tax=Thiorhodovibrio frisius TaxID=631362 RepID=H8Z7M4_9GAMM|nr:UDP-glucose 4-epimerase GalE [Thiorhodovibrio frisius]EIC19877.1 UDP-glucose-4-epimerase [Thiorhodovibrio frisius]WPL20605.1 UDP-glucose 4-epimerase [Thiorhodovibrio frisius]